MPPGIRPEVERPILGRKALESLRKMLLEVLAEMEVSGKGVGAATEATVVPGCAVQCLKAMIQRTGEDVFVLLCSLQSLLLMGAL